MVAVPLPAEYRIGLEVGGGRVWGTAPAQRLWYVGGPSTLRGFDPRAQAHQALVGELTHGPLQLARCELSDRHPAGAIGRVPRALNAVTAGL